MPGLAEEEVDQAGWVIWVKRGGIALEEGAGVDEIGGGEAEAAQFAHSEAHGQVRVSGKRRKKEVR